MKNCDATFPCHRDIEIHLNTHRNIGIECNFCQYKNANKPTWKTHMTVHFGIQSYECDQCDKKFYTQAQLNIHYEKHEGIKYKCKLCEKYETGRKNNIVLHMRNIHKGDMERFNWDIVRNFVTVE